MSERPTWYDLLDVDPRAEPDEVRAAWRRGIDGLDPTDRRFAVRNQAAAVLLDPAKRAAYDAELTAAAQADTEAGDPVELEAPPRDVRTGPGPTGGATSTGRSTRRDLPVVPGWLLAGLGGLVAVLLVVVVVGLATSDEPTQVDDGREARASAERAVVPVLSYDYRELEKSKADAETYMTPGFRETFDRTFAFVEQGAPQLKAVVTSELVASSVSRVSGDTVDVMCFFNQTTVNTAGTKVARNYVTLRMTKEGGDWLVDDLITQPATT